MSPKKKRRKSTHRRERTVEEVQTPRPEAVIVAWVLCTLVTLATELAALGTFALVTSFERAELVPKQLAVLPGLLAFSALVTGVVSLGLSAWVLRFGPIRPPRKITLFSVAVGLAPLLYYTISWTLA